MCVFVRGLCDVCVRRAYETCVCVVFVCGVCVCIFHHSFYRGLHTFSLFIPFFSFSGFAVSFGAFRRTLTELCNDEDDDVVLDED